MSVRGLRGASSSSGVECIFFNTNSRALIEHSHRCGGFILPSWYSTQFENGAFLTAQLTIPCDGSEHRAYWVSFSAVALATYALGGEFEWYVPNNTT